MSVELRIFTKRWIFFTLDPTINFMKEVKILSLRSKVIVVFVALVAVSMLILLVLNYYTDLTKQKEEYITYTEDMLALSAVNLTFELRQVLDLTLAPYMNDTLFNLLAGKGAGSAETEILENSLLPILNSNSYITQVHLFSEAKQESFVARNHNLYRRKSTAVRDEGIPQDVSVFCQTQHSYGIPFNRNSEGLVVTVSRNLYNLPGREYVGRIDIDVALGFFVDANATLYSGDDDIVACLSEGNRIIYAYPDAGLAEAILSDLVFEGEDGNVSLRNDGIGYTLLYRKVSPGSGLDPVYIVKIIENSMISRNAKEAGLRTFLVGVVTTVIALFLIGIVTSKFLEPFGYIEGQLAKISGGDLNVSLELMDSKEFSRLASQFNAMIDTINNVIIRNYQLDLENKNNQLKALQAQLDPHFINNTLQTIGAEALKKGNLELYSAILHFGEMMRYTMNFREMKVRFGDEVEYTENYLNFQKMRFGNCLDYIVEISPDVLEMEVPKLLLQPIVENSIKHGYNDAYVGMVSISIHAAVERGYFSMTCSNSGVGLGPTELSMLRRNLEKARDGGEESTNIGLRNLARRLQILYGDRALLNVDSKEEKGFSVTLKIPLEDTDAQCSDSR